MKAKRIVLATHGTLGDFHPYLAIALELRARGHQPVIATSEYYRQKIEATGDPLNQPSEPLPRGVIAVDYAPYAQVFPHASVIVHQGGIGTTAQALRAGKPMLVVPCGGDQYDNADRIDRLGVGLTITRKRYNRDRAAFALKRLIEDSNYAKLAEALGRHVREENGVHADCNAVEEQLM